MIVLHTVLVDKVINNKILKQISCPISYVVKNRSNKWYDRIAGLIGLIPYLDSNQYFFYPVIFYIVSQHVLILLSGFIQSKQWSVYITYMYSNVAFVLF